VSPHWLIDFFISSQTGIPGISKFLEILDYWNLRDVLRPHVKKLVNRICGHVMRDVEEMEQMTEPRIIKSHLPLYLLNPKLLDTSKVIIFLKILSSMKKK
jgi:hypothetical protein